MRECEIATELRNDKYLRNRATGLYVLLQQAKLVIGYIHGREGEGRAEREESERRIG